ncbi:MAG: CBS domain-containing protein [Candidatus Micrarchaeota archaeon]
MEYEEAAVFDGGEPLSKALNEILTSGTIAVVTEKGKYYGIIDDREMRGGISDSSRAKCITAAVRAPAIEEGMDAYGMMGRFLAGHFKALPVVRGGRVVGLVGRAKLMQRLLQERAIPKIGVDIIMSSPIYTVDANETVGVAKRIMKGAGVHRLAITENRKVIGTVSTMDFSRVLLKPKGRDFLFVRDVDAVDQKQVREFMRDRFVSVGRDETLHAAAERMAAHNVSAVLVMEGSKAVGVVTARDVMKFIMGLHAERPEVFISGLGEEDVQHYDAIRNALRAAVRKFTDTFGINSISVRVKKGKTTYLVATHVAMEQETLPLRVEAFDLKSAVDGTASEIKRLLTKRKAYRTMRKRPFYAEES